MKIGIGLPGNVPGAKGDIILEWARRADAGPFSSLGIIDRLVYDNYEPLVLLSAAAAVTTRVRRRCGTQCYWPSRPPAWTPFPTDAYPWAWA